MLIALSGAQCTGKTTLLNALRNDKAFQDRFMFIDEIVRTLQRKGFKINEAGTDETQLAVMHEHETNTQLEGDVLVDSLWICSAGINLGIVILSLVEHIQPFASVGQWRLDTIDGTAEGTMIGNLCLSLLATLGGNKDNAAGST